MQLKPVNVDEVLEQFRKDIFDIVTENIINLAKLNINSELVKSVEVFTDNNTIDIRMNNYAIYLDKGRKALMKKIPFSVIYRWVLKNKIKFNDKTYIQTAYMIRNSIYKKGIRPRNFLKVIQEDVERIVGFGINDAIISQFEDNLENIFANAFN